MTLVDEVRALLQQASASVDGPNQTRLGGALARLDEPVRVAIAGKVKAGKSTLLNALVGEELAPTDAGECTRIVTWYLDGHTYSVELHQHDGVVRQVPFKREDGALEVDLGATDPADVRRLEVRWPSARLREMTLIDTPGIESLSTDISSRTVDFLTPDDDRVPEADAVLYLMRHMHGSDMRFLESFHDDEIAQPSPINAIGILSRADEVGSCRIDAMQSAERIAGRYASDAKLRRLVQTVVPVSGLLAQGAATMSEDDFRALSAIAGMPVDDRELLLLSADRFTADDRAEAVVPVVRHQLLERYGMFGVRRCIDQIAAGKATSSPALVRDLNGQSGVENLRSILVRQFGERASLLKVRSALDAVDQAAHDAGGSAGAALAVEVERVAAGAHELVEIRLLNQLLLGGLTLREADHAALERLISGGSVTTRLGLPDDLSAEAQRAALAEALNRWQSRAESAMSSQDVKDAARVAVRTCEGMFTELTPVS